MVEPAEDQHLAARQQRGVELEARILGRRADQGDRAVLDIRQEAVLLGAVEAVDLVHEQQGLLAGAGRGRASAKIFLRSATPENTAEIATKRRPTASASRRAMLVLPVPGGPHRIIEASLPAATIRPIAPSGPVRCSWPTISSSERGRSRSASGALAGGASGGWPGRPGRRTGRPLRRQDRRSERKLHARRLAKMQLRYILDASKGETLCTTCIMVAARAAGSRSTFPKALMAMRGGRGWRAIGARSTSTSAIEARERGRGGRRYRGRKRMFESGELRLVLLKLIADEPRHGYDLIRAIEEMTGGEYAPSPGVIYPTLTLLQDMGLIEEAPGEGPRKPFQVTEEGRAHLEENERRGRRPVRAAERPAATRGADAGPAIGRAVKNLMTALRHRIGRDGLDDELLHEIAAILDEAAQRIERTK